VRAGGHESRSTRLQHACLRFGRHAGRRWRLAAESVEASGQVEARVSAEPVWLVWESSGYRGRGGGEGGMHCRSLRPQCFSKLWCVSRSLGSLRLPT
jgi:hypothetical protein